jgi:uncharacterized protein (DUF3084 family)
VYVPVVDKEALWTKRCKDPTLVGTVKEVIKQVSHSKKWPRFKTENGWVNSYSLLQDRFHDHMKAVGFEGFERGERGSTAEHLTIEKYKVKMERERAAEYAAIANEKQEAATELDKGIGTKEQTAVELDTTIAEKSKKSATLDRQVAKTQKQLDGLTEKTVVVEKVVAEIEEIEKLGHKRTITGAVSIPSKFWDKILNLVKEAFKSRTEIKELRAEIRHLKGEVKSANEAFEQQKSAYLRLSERVKPYLEAVSMFPEYMKEALDSLIASGRKQQEEYRKARQVQPPEQTAPAPKRKRSTGLDL